MTTGESAITSYRGTAPKSRKWNNEFLLLIVVSFIKYGPIPASFSCFVSFSHFNSKFRLKNAKRRWHAMDSNPGPRDCRLRQIHWAMVAALVLLCLFCAMETSSMIKKKFYIWCWLVFNLGPTILHQACNHHCCNIWWNMVSWRMDFAL